MPSTSRKCPLCAFQHQQIRWRESDRGISAALRRGHAWIVERVERQDVVAEAYLDSNDRPQERHFIDHPLQAVALGKVGHVGGGTLPAEALEARCFRPQRHGARFARLGVGKVSDLNARLKKVYLGGGEKRIEKLKADGKMTARERIDALLDPKSPRIEIGAFAADGMYTEHGGAPSAGVVVVIGYVSKRQCIVVANDATVKAGAWFPMTGKKNLRAQEIAIENRLPIIYLVDSAGVYLPMQDEIFPDKEHFGRIFRNNAVMSSMGITQIAAIMGSCVAGGAYLPIMSDEALIVEKTGSIFLAGSYLVKAAIGEDIDNETLGGATTHSEISGVTDYKCKDDADCLKKIRAIVDKLGKPKDAGFSREKSRKPKADPKEIYGILPTERAKPYDMREVIARWWTTASTPNTRKATARASSPPTPASTAGPWASWPTSARW
jgi:acetyl-CoA carboxylase carboxyltransferase component